MASEGGYNLLVSSQIAILHSQAEHFQCDALPSWSRATAILRGAGGMRSISHLPAMEKHVAAQWTLLHEAKMVNPLKC
jgi:hypothetical protein